MIVVGNKVDLDSERAVTAEEGQSLANNFNSAPFLEISVSVSLLKGVSSPSMPAPFPLLSHITTRCYTYTTGQGEQAR